MAHRAALTICPLGSGSRGNSLYIGTPDGAVLIDAGFSARETFRRMALAALDPATIRAVLITHEHGDHIGGLGPLTRKLQIPAYLTAGTYRAVGSPILPDVRLIVAGSSFDLGPLHIEAVPLPHDAADPVAYLVTWEGKTVGCVTDLGHPSQLVIDRLRRCAFLVCEANHDEQMLLDGPYPWSVKQRIRGRHGHLSNHQGLALMEGMLHPGVEGIVLAHLSEKCNRPELAWGLFNARLRELGAGHIPLWTATQTGPLVGITLRPL